MTVAELNEASAALRDLLAAYVAFEEAPFTASTDWEADCLGLAQVAFTHVWGVVELMEVAVPLLIDSSSSGLKGWPLASFPTKSYAGPAPAESP